MKTVAGVKIEATTKDAISLFNKSSRLLAKMEHNGIKIDVQYIKTAKSKMFRKAKKIQDTLDNKFPDVMKPWRKKYGKGFKLGSREQLGVVFFDILGYKSKEKTESGRNKSDEKTLSSIKHPFIKEYFNIAKIKKAVTTLEGIEREVDDKGYLHPNYNLHIARTYRSSSDNPNFQNFQVRIEEMARLIRMAFVSRWKNGRIVEIDFKTLEVLIAACYHKDPNMLKHLREDYDYHKNLAAKIFCCKVDKVQKDMRYSAKNQFVFPEFYGDYYASCAKNIWEYIDIKGLMMGDTPMKDHLKKKGIIKLGKCDPEKTPREGTFEKHIKDIEDFFWNKEYPVYTAWKKKWYNAYLETGEVPFLTGFVARGIMARNQVINYAVQGAAFHCLLWTVLRIESELRKRGMKTLLMGQIHDCVLSDVPDDELQDYLNLVNHIVSVELPKAMKWIIVPMSCEMEVCPVGGTWFDKKQYIKQDKKWIPKPLAA